MKAYQVTEFSVPLETREIARPEPTGTEVLIKVGKAGVCHSDLHLHGGYYSLCGDARLDLAELRSGKIVDRRSRGYVQRMRQYRPHIEKQAGFA